MYSVLRKRAGEERNERAAAGKRRTRTTHAVAVFIALTALRAVLCSAAIASIAWYAYLIHTTVNA
jgi:hypothetical protein